MRTKTASKASVDAGRNLLYNSDSKFEHLTPDTLESCFFQPSKNNPTVSVFHYKLKNGPRKAVLACLVMDAGVLAESNGQIAYTGKPVIQAINPKTGVSELVVA
jgi:hypothetical protein